MGNMPLGSDEDSEPITGGEKPRNWGLEWKESLRNHWDNIVPIPIQGDSFAHQDFVFDLDPTFKDAYGMLLLCVTFDRADDDRRRHKFLAERCVEMMQEMGAEQIAWVPELPTSGRNPCVFCPSSWQHLTD